MGTIAFEIGCLLAVLVLYSIWRLFLRQRIADAPIAGRFEAATAAYITAGIVAGFGMADGGALRWLAFLTYLPSAVIVAAFAIWRGLVAKRRILAEQDMPETFN